MNTCSNSTGAAALARTDANQAKAFKNLENAIHDLKQMAAAAGHLTADQLGVGIEPDGLVTVTERMANLLLFVTSDVEHRAERLADRFEAAFRGECTDA